MSDWSSDVCASDLSARRAQKGCCLVEYLALFGIAQPADQRQLWRDRTFAVHESRIGVGALAIVVSDGVEPRQAKERQQVERVKFIVSLHLVPGIKGAADQIEVGGVIGKPQFLRILVDPSGVGAIE